MRMPPNWPRELAGVEGLEPPASGFGDRRSSQLSYTPSVGQRLSRGCTIHGIGRDEGARKGAQAMLSSLYGCGAPMTPGAFGVICARGVRRHLRLGRSSVTPCRRRPLVARCRDKTSCRAAAFPRDDDIQRLDQLRHHGVRVKRARCESQAFLTAWHGRVVDRRRIHAEFVQ
jgi:hypothetical protein